MGQHTVGHRIDSAFYSLPPLRCTMRALDATSQPGCLTTFRPPVSRVPIVFFPRPSYPYEVTARAQKASRKKTRRICTCGIINGSYWSAVLFFEVLKKILLRMLLLFVFYQWKREKYNGELHSGATLYCYLDEFTGMFELFDFEMKREKLEIDFATEFSCLMQW